MPHTRKVLSQAGVSLADIYDVEGSIVGIDALDVEDIKGVHDLGPLIHSERLQTFMLRADSTAVAASTVWNISLAAIPDSINRLLSISVFADVGARVDHCQCSIGDPESGLDHVIWAWDSAVDSVINLREFGAVVNLLRPVTVLSGGLPNLLTRTGASGTRMPNLIFRGVSTAFGAGTVRAQAMMQICRPDPGAPTPGEPSSFGLPLPSW